MSMKHMAGFGCSDRFVQSRDELPEDERLWWCDNCGAVFDRHHSERGDKFCNNCEYRHGLLNPCDPVGPDADQVFGNGEEVCNDG